MFNRFIATSLSHFAAALTAIAAMSITLPACASYIGLQVTSQQQVIGGTVRNVYRVYTTFSDPNDYLVAVGASPALGPLVILSRNTADSGPGGNFINDDFGFDFTFPAIGSADIEVTFPVHEFIIGNSFMLADGGWFTPGPVEEARAGYLGDGDPLLRVLTMQLTVSTTSHVRGTVAITGVNNNPLAGGTAFTVTGQTFNSVPAPGVLPVLGLAALFPHRRRRQVSGQGHSSSSKTLTMKQPTLGFIMFIVASMLFASDASAVYLGLQVFGQRMTLQNGTLMNRFRVYAMCSDPLDYIHAVAGSPTLGNLILQSRNADDTGPGSNFFNPPGGSPKSPTLAAIALNPDVEHDTFVTIGISIAEQGSGIPPNPPDDTHLSPGFVGVGNVTELNTNNAGWFSLLKPQGQAGYLGDGDPLLRVLIMQLTVSSTSNVRGTVTIATTYNVPLAGIQSFNLTGQTFNSVPAPGALTLVGLAALIARRRGRRAHVTSISPRRGNSP